MRTSLSSQHSKTGAPDGNLAMKLILWLLVAVAGLAIMAWTYFGYVRLDEAAP